MVGVIANLAVFFALHALFDDTDRKAWGPLRLDVPVLSSWDPTAFGLTALALLLIFRFGFTPLRTLGVLAPLGLVVTLLT